MHKHHMPFTDFNGKPREVDLYFNLSEAELTKMQISSNFGLQKELEDALANEDNKKLLDFMEYLVHHSYGIKSEDGMTFRKSPEIMAEFEQSAYYSDLYMSLFQEEGQVAVRFINSVMPPELLRRAEANARGEGELAQRAAAAKGFDPDARSIFEQSRNGLQDHKQKVSEPIVVEEAPKVSQQYVPQNQPVYPQVSERTAEDEAAFQAWKNSQQGNVPAFREPAEDPNATPQTRAALRQDQPAQVIPDGITGVIPRPPHESGPGFEVSTEQ